MAIGSGGDSVSISTLPGVFGVNKGETGSPGAVLKQKTHPANVSLF